METMDVRGIISFIQSFSQSYFRTKDYDAKIAANLLDKLNYIWNYNIENNQDGYIKDNEILYTTTATVVLDKFRINSKELKDDLNNLYDNGFNKLAYWIYKNN